MIASVVIAVRNGEAFIDHAIRSALGQTLQSLEVIVVDDGSTDRTAQLVEDHWRGDDRVILIRHETSKGVSAARNTAIAKASGDWIAVLDADDTYLPDRLARMIAEAERLGADMLGDNLLLIDFDTKKPLGPAFPSEWMQHCDLVSLTYMAERDLPTLTGNMFGLVQPIIRRSFLNDNGLRYDEGVRVAEDFLLYAQCLFAGARFRLLDEAYYVYSIRSDSSSRGSDSQAEVARVNRLLIAEAKTLRRAELPMLRNRQNILDFETLVWSVRRRQLSQALAALSRIPPGYLLKSLRPILARKLARTIGRPAQPRKAA